MKKKGLLPNYVWEHKWAYLMGVIGLLVVDFALLYIPRLTGEIADGVKDGTMTMDGVKTNVMWIMIVTMIPLP